MFLYARRCYMFLFVYCIAFMFCHCVVLPYCVYCGFCVCDFLFLFKKQCVMRFFICVAIICLFFVEEFAIFSDGVCGVLLLCLLCVVKVCDMFVVCLLFLFLFFFYIFVVFAFAISGHVLCYVWLLLLCCVVVSVCELCYSCFLICFS